MNLYRIHCDSEACGLLIGFVAKEQGVLNAGLAIEARAGFAARPEKWW